MNEINVSEISELNIFISCTEGMYLNMSLEKGNVKCINYYCYGTSDTREDGQSKHNPEVFDNIAGDTLKFTRREINTPLPENFKLKIEYTTAGGNSETITEIDRNAFMELLMSISNNIEEFIFVNGFRYYL